MSAALLSAMLITPSAASVPAVEAASLPQSASSAHPSGAHPSGAHPSGAHPSGAHPSAVNAPSAAKVASTTSPPGHTYTGKAFDKCDTPSLAQLKAWDASPYRAIAVYVGGHNRHCKTQQHLTKDWVAQVQADNWSLIPLFVGRQSSCYVTSKEGFTFIDPAKARQQGKESADKAVEAMQQLGLGPDKDNPVYYNMETWDSHTTPEDQQKCAREVVTFIDAWTTELHDQGYLSGFYSSTKSFIPAVVSAAQHQNSFTRPDALWIAHHGTAPTTSDPAVPEGLWANHQRIKQYRAPHDETWGGVTFNIDTNIVDGPVAASGTLTIGPEGMPTLAPGQQLSTKLSSTGAHGTVTYRLVGGSLPDGITLSKTGTLSGATDVLGDSTITIRAVDADGAFGVRTYRLIVAFPDVPVSHGFFDDIAWLANRGITRGNTDGTFGPTNPVTRGQMAAFLYRMTHDAAPKKCTKSGGGPFPDVAFDATFCPEITWLSHSGITGGYGDGTFRPGKEVSRQAMAAFLYRMTHAGHTAPRCATSDDGGDNSGRFDDVPRTSTFCGAIQWLAKAGVTSGYDDGTFKPGRDVSRQAMAAFLHRLPPPSRP